jgi:lipopolysaccharide transport system ATP-binding protein
VASYISGEWNPRSPTWLDSLHAMSDMAISVEGIGKLYKLGERERYSTLRDRLTGLMRDPFCRFRRQPVRDETAATLWALRDVSFNVQQGEVVGIIGRNGSGKSTLLKVLSRITEPTQGTVRIRGRVGSLLEVGTGFHPELTGRENIFLNGAILGMGKSEIARKFDEIVAFAEVERFIDTPVKHYSSGMYVRLAFAVAAHLEPEIMIVDEVLAVGDLTFQQKCLGKMGDVAKQGRTVLLVTHNMLPVRTLCTRAILLGEGRVLADTCDVRLAIGLYSGLKTAHELEWQRGDLVHSSDSPLIFTKLRQVLLGEQPRHKLQVTAELQSLRLHPSAFIAVDVLDSSATSLLQAIPTQIPFIEFSNTPQEVVVTIDLPPLIPGTYQITVWAGPHYSNTFDHVEMELTFIVTDSPQPGRSFPHSVDHGFVVPESTVTVRRLSEAAQVLEPCT